MKKVMLKIVGVLIIVIFLLQSNIVIAAETQNSLNNKQKDTNQKIEEAKEELQNIKTEKSDTLKQVEDLMSQIGKFESQINELDSKISDLNTKIKDAEVNLKKAEDEYVKQEELLEARLVATYEAGDTSYLDVLLSSEGITDLISNYYLVTELATNDAELLEEIQKQKEEIANAKKTLEEGKNELVTSKASKEKVSIQLQSSKKEKDTYVSKLNESEKQTQADLERFEADKRAIANQIYVLAQEEAKKNQQSNNNNNGNSGNSSGGSSSNGGNTTPSASGYIRPVAGYSITTGWYGYSGHTGVDFSGSGISGKPVVAVKSGTVVTSTASKNSQGNYVSYGEYIIINHHDSTMTLYAHGAPGSRVVGVGQSVSQGQKIMSVGTTGNSTGYHLHFEVWLNGKQVNPAPYLP